MLKFGSEVIIFTFVDKLLLLSLNSLCLCLGSLTWLQRIKVALGFTRALEFLHDPKKPYLVRNINAAHIILDQVQ